MALHYLTDLSTVGQGSKGVLALADPNCLGAFAKGTEGLSFEDPNYHRFHLAAKSYYKPCGPYHFLHPDEDGAAQARYLLAYTKPLPGDFEPVVDTETLHNGDWRQCAATTYAALVELRNHNFRPLQYGSTSFLEMLVEHEPRLKEFAAWEAEYNAILYRVPGLRAVLWQNTDHMVVAKGRLRVDGDKLLIRNIDSLRIPRGKKVRHPEPPKPPAKPAAKRKPAPKPAEAKKPIVKPVPKPKPERKPKPKKQPEPNKFWTYRKDVPLKPGEEIGYVRGKGYYPKKRAA